MSINVPQEQNVAATPQQQLPMEVSPSKLVAMLSPEDKKTIMSLCMPKNASDSELALFLYKCKQMGLDPLSKDLVLQKWTNKDGSVSLNFITTRDALLKKAEQNPNYNGINSGVVREGDEFLVDTEKSVVRHTFGAKRGKILAGWAVAYHKSRNPVIAIADFEEYFRANASSPVWQSVPSAMIQKVAEVMALRKQFPIVQGVYTREELPVGEEAEAARVVDVVADAVAAIEVTPEMVETTMVETTEETTTQTKREKDPLIHMTPPQQQSQQRQQPQKEQQPPQQQQPETSPQDAYKLLAVNTGRSSTGTPYAKVGCVSPDGETKVLLAKGEEGLAIVANLKEGCYFKAQTVNEKGFEIITSLEVI